MRKIIIALLLILLVSTATAKDSPRLYVMFDDGETVEGAPLEQGFLETEEGYYFSVFYSGKVEGAYIEIDGEVIIWEGESDMTGYYAEWIWHYNGELSIHRVVKDFPLEPLPDTGEGG